MISHKLVLATLVLLGGAATASAQDLRDGLLRRFDADQDGRLSPEERRAAREYLLERRGLSGHRDPGARFRRAEPEVREVPDEAEVSGMLGRLRARYDLDGDGTLDATEATRAREMWRELRGRTDLATAGDEPGGPRGREGDAEPRRRRAEPDVADVRERIQRDLGRRPGRRVAPDPWRSLPQPTPFERGFGRVPGGGREAAPERFRQPAPQREFPPQERRATPSPRVAPTPAPAPRVAPPPAPAPRVAPPPRPAPPRPQAQPQPQRRNPQPPPQRRQQQGQQRRPV